MHHWRAWILIGSALLVAAGIAGCQQASEPPPPPSPALRLAADRFLFTAEHLRIGKAALGDSLHQDLASARYDAAITLLSKLDQTTRKDPRYEFVYRDTLDAIGNCDAVDESLEYRLQQMQEAKPHSAWPHVLLGHYYDAMACKARGTGWARNVDQDQWSTMVNFDRRAAAEYREAMAINPNLFPVYDGLMGIINREDTLSQITVLYQQSHKYLPDSYLMAADYMNALRPRWHGSYALMNRFAREMRKSVNGNPRFYDLAGYVAADQANLAYNDRNFTEAFQLYTHALAYGDYPSWLEWGGESARGINRYRAAYAYYQRYLIYKPQNADAQKRWREFAFACKSTEIPQCRDQGYPWAAEPAELISKH